MNNQGPNPYNLPNPSPGETVGIPMSTIRQINNDDESFNQMEEMMAGTGIPNEPGENGEEEDYLNDD